MTWFIEDRPPRGYAARVKAALVGSYERGVISVADHTVPAGAGTMVFLVPPEVVVRVQLVAGGPAHYAFTVTINGRTIHERGTVAGGKTRIERAYPFVAFALDPAAPPPDDAGRRERAAVVPERQRIGGIPLPPGVQLRTRGASVSHKAAEPPRSRPRAAGPDRAKKRRDNDLTS